MSKKMYGINGYYDSYGRLAFTTQQAYDFAVDQYKKEIMSGKRMVKLLTQEMAGLSFDSIVDWEAIRLAEDDMPAIDEGRKRVWVCGIPYDFHEGKEYVDYGWLDLNQTSFFSWHHGPAGFTGNSIKEAYAIINELGLPFSLDNIMTFIVENHEECYDEEGDYLEYVSWDDIACHLREIINKAYENPESGTVLEIGDMKLIYGPIPELRDMYEEAKQKKEAPKEE